MEKNSLQFFQENLSRTENAVINHLQNNTELDLFSCIMKYGYDINLVMNLIESLFINKLLIIGDSGKVYLTQTGKEWAKEILKDYKVFDPEWKNVPEKFLRKEKIGIDETYIPIGFINE